MVATPTSKPILHAIAPRIAVGNAERTQVFYGRIGFACTHQEEGFMIVERDGVQLAAAAGKDLARTADHPNQEFFELLPWRWKLTHPPPAAKAA